LLVLGGLAGVAAAVACGGIEVATVLSSNPVDAGVDRSDVAVTGLPPVTSADAGVDGAASATSAPDAGPAVIGFVYLDYSQLVANLGHDPSTTITKIGDCWVERYTNAQTTWMSAGTLTVTGAKEPITAVEYLNGAYSVSVGNGVDAPYAAGATLTVHATGAAVPAFETSVVAPAALTVTGAGTLDGHGNVVVHQGEPLVVTWAPVQAPIVSVALTQYTAASGIVASCMFAASALTGTLPADLIAQLTAGSDAGTAVEIMSAVTTVVDAGPYAVRFSVSGPALEADGGLYAHGFVLE
jgi:hypothetical protein